MRIVIPTDDVGANHGGLFLVAGVVGAIEGEVAERLELGIAPVEP